MTLFQITVLVCTVLVTALITFLYVERKKPSAIRSLPPDSHACEALEQARTSKKGHKLEFSNSSGQIAFEITHVHNSLLKKQGWKENNHSLSSTQFIEPLLEQATEVLKLPLLAQMASSKTFHVVFKAGGVLMRSKAGEGFRAMLVDQHSHRITCHGLLDPVVNSPADILLIWECVAVLAQRKYLVDINRKLKGLQTSLAKVEGFLLDHQTASLEAGSKEIQRIADRLRSDPSFLFHSSTLQNTVESIRANASVTTHHLIKTINRRTESLRQETELKGFWDAPKEHVESPTEDVLNALHSASYSILLEAYCAALLASYLDDDTYWRDRLKEASMSLTSIQECSITFHRLAKEKINSLDERFRFKQTVNEKRANLQKTLTTSFKEGDEVLRGTRNVIASIEGERGLLGIAQNDLSLLVTVDKKGKIVSVSRPVET